MSKVLSGAWLPAQWSCKGQGLEYKLLTCASAASVSGVCVFAATHASAKVSMADWKSILSKYEFPDTTPLLLQADMFTVIRSRK